MKSKAVPGVDRTEQGKRTRPDARELAIFTQGFRAAGGSRKRRPAAVRFATRFAARVSRYPAVHGQPRWLRALVQTGVSVEEVFATLRNRLQRAPSKANQEFALVLANELARKEGGSEALSRHLTPELFARLSGKREK